MVTVKACTTTEYYFSNEVEEKIRNYAKENYCSLEVAVCDLIDIGELNLELDSVHEDPDEPEITEVTEI